MKHFFFVLINLFCLYIAPWFVCFSIGFISVLTVNKLFSKTKIKIKNFIKYIIAFVTGALFSGVPITIFYYIWAENTPRYAYKSGGEVIEGALILLGFIISSTIGTIFGGIGGIFATGKILKNRWSE